MTGVVDLMASPKALARWLSDWRSLGGIVSVGAGPFGPDHEIVPALLILGPVLDWNDPRRRRVETLKGWVAEQSAQYVLARHLQREQATKGNIC